MARPPNPMDETLVLMLIHEQTMHELRVQRPC